MQSAAELNKRSTLCLDCEGRLVLFGGELHVQNYNFRSTNTQNYIEGQELPRTIQPIQHVVSVGLGKNHIIAATKNGSVWTMGSNIRDQLGFSERDPLTELKQVEQLNNIISVKCGNSHNLCLNNEGNLFSFGDNQYGQLGRMVQYDFHLNSNTILEYNVCDYSPEQIIFSTKIHQIFCGAEYSIFIDENFYVFGFGKNNIGQLGNTENLNWNFKAIKCNLPDVPFIQVACGFSHTLFLDHDGHVYSCGNNYSGQLGHDDKNQRTTPVLIEKIPKIQSVFCGLYHSVLLDFDFNVWVFGYNGFNQLGIENIPKSDDILVPTKVTVVQNIQYVSSGGNSLILKDKSGQTFVFGCNTGGQLGINPTTLVESDSLTCTKLDNNLSQLFGCSPSIAKSARK